MELVGSRQVLPYSIACLVFAFIMVPAGQMQDRFGPRITATIGGLLVGLGIILASRTTSMVGSRKPLTPSDGERVVPRGGMGFGYFYPEIYFGNRSQASHTKPSRRAQPVENQSWI